MDYKINKLKLDDRKMIKKFLDYRKDALDAKVKEFFNTNEQYEQEQIKEYFKTNFSLYILGTMYLYEDAILYECYNNLKEEEKLSLFLKYFARLIINEKLSFLNHYNYITKEELTKTLTYNFLAYEQNIIIFLECIKKYNPKFKFSY